MKTITTKDAIKTITTHYIDRAAILMVLWLTSAFWLFGTHGVSL
jgi:hypothetical protein